MLVGGRNGPLAPKLPALWLTWLPAGPLDGGGKFPLAPKPPSLPTGPLDGGRRFPLVPKPLVCEAPPDPVAIERGDPM